jgi:hypothetical protein
VLQTYIHVLGFQEIEENTEMISKNPIISIEHTKSMVDVEDLSSATPSNDQTGYRISKGQLKK